MPIDLVRYYKCTSCQSTAGYVHQLSCTRKKVLAAGDKEGWYDEFDGYLVGIPGTEAWACQNCGHIVRRADSEWKNFDWIYDDNDYYRKRTPADP